MLNRLSTRSGRIDQYDSEAFEISNARLRLRTGWSFTMRSDSQLPTFVLFHSEQSQHYEIGWSQYALLSLWDGHKSLSECVGETSQLLGDAAPSIEQAIQTAHWALKLGLAEAVGHDGQTITHSPPDVATTSASVEQMLGRANPLLIKMRLGDPSLWMAAWPQLGHTLMAVGRGLSSSIFAGMWLCLMLVAAVQLVAHATDVWHSSQEILDIRNGLWIALTCLCLKVIHELAHASVCLALGGKVQETGLMFVLLMPVPYVDVSSSWQFNSRLARMQVAAAGMAIELLVAAIATICWANVHEPWLRYHLFNVMVAASVTTLLFNANFLMRFDGYFLLSDALGIVNLYARGQQAVTRQAQRWLLGYSPSHGTDRSQHESGLGRILIGFYGLAALGWRCLVTVTMTLTAARMFQGVGILFATLSVILWLSPGLRSLISQVAASDSSARRSRRYLALVTTPTLALLIAISIFCPWPFRVHAPAIVRYQDSQDVRALTAGFVRAVKVVDGQMVAAGEPLLILENRELETQRQRVAVELDAAHLRSRRYHARGEIANYQSERAVCQALDAQLADLDHRLAELNLRAPIAGKVVQPSLDSLRGCFLMEGQVALQIINDESKELVAWVDQPDVEFFSAARGAPVTLSLRGVGGALTGQLQTVTPKASLKCDVRLTSLAGGPLAIRKAAESSSDPGTLSDSIVSGESSLGSQGELLRARFEAIIALPESESRRLRSGMTGDVGLPGYGRSIATHIVQRCRDFLQ